MRYTNTLNNHPKNKRKKNYYHNDVKPLPLIIQSHIADSSNDWFLTEMQKMNNAFNHYYFNEHLCKNMNRYTFQYTIQPTVDILHHHLNDESNANFFVENNSTIDITEFETPFKQNKNIETIKEQFLTDIFGNKNSKTYIELLNNYHLLDFENIEKAINSQIPIPFKHLKTHLKYDAKIKNQTNKSLSDYFKFIQSIVKKHSNQNQRLTSSQIDAVKTLLFQKYNLSLVVETIKQTLKPIKDNEAILHDGQINEILSKLLKQQYKINEVIELLKIENNRNLTPKAKDDIIKNIIKINPELLILKNNHQINIDVNELLKNETFDSIPFSTILHLLIVDHGLSRKNHKHLTNKQYKSLKQLIQHIKNKDENYIITSHFTNLYETSNLQDLHHDLYEVIAHKFETFTFTELEFFKSIDDAKNLLNNTLYEYDQALGDISDNAIINNVGLYERYDKYDLKFSNILNNITVILKQPYRFYQTFNYYLSHELKALTIEERLKIDQYLPTKKIKLLLNTIQRHKNKSRNTKSIIANIDQNEFANEIMFKNAYAQKQFIKYFNPQYHYRTQQITGIYNDSNDLKNYAFKQIIQQSTNPHQQFHLNAETKLNNEDSKENEIFKYKQLVKEAMLKNKQQYAKQIIETFKQINRYIEANNNEINDNFNNREYLKNKQELLQSIIKHTSNDTILDQLKQTYQQNVLDKEENNLNANDDAIKYLNLYHLSLNEEALNELLDRYPKTFRLVEPIVHNAESIK